ncbi:MAG: hypothetical protein ABEK84_09935 [Salinibacter sp.]
MSTSTLADSLYERLRRALPADRAYAPADWETDAMPDPVRHYLTHLLRHHHRREARRLRRARSEWVHYDHPEMEQATQSFLDAVEEHMQVPRDQWTDTLQTAVHRTTDHLVRPVPTLTSFVFEEASGPVTLSHLQWRMRFFGPYAYLRNAIEAYAEKRDRDAFGPDVFERTLRRVDERMTADFDADRWGRLLDPLFETAQCATGRPEVPRSLLRTFFEEKNASLIADRLVEHDADAVGPDTLHRLIADVSTPASSDQPAAPEASSNEPPLASDLQPSTEAASPSSTPSSPETENSGTTPMWKQFEQNPSRRNSGTKGAEEEHQPLWTQFRQQTPSSRSGTGSSSSDPQSSPSRERPSPPSETSALSALEREVFGNEHPPNRSVYVRELFGGDTEAYRQILERLRTTESWSTASQIIASDVFRAHQVNIYSDAAVHFTNAVEAGYKET